MENPSSSHPSHFWKAFFLSFFSPAFYRRVGVEGKGWAYGYLFLLLAILMVPRAFSFQKWVGEFLPPMASKIPDLKMQKGQLSSSVSQPYRADWAPGQTLILDTTGKIQHLDQIPDLDKLQIVFLVTKTGFEERRVSLGLARDQAHDFASMPDFQMTQVQWQKMAAEATRWSGAAAYLILGALWFCFEALFLPTYALLGLGASKLAKRTLDFDGALRLAVFSHTPALTLAAIFPWLLGGEEPISMCIFVSLGLLLFAVIGQPEADPK